VGWERRASTERLCIDVRNAGRGTCLIAIRGEIDIASAPALRQTFLDLITEGCTDLAVDAQDLEFVDSTGIGVLIGCRQRLQTMEGTFAIVGASDRIRRTLEVAGVASTLLSAEAPPD
jgi:anti-sigma B factor antagonist